MTGTFRPHLLPLLLVSLLSVLCPLAPLAAAAALLCRRPPRSRRNSPSPSPSISTSSTALQASQSLMSSTNKTAKARFDFWRGHPNDDLLPADVVKSVLLSLASSSSDDGADGVDDDTRRALRYGKERGNDDLLSELRSFLDRQMIDDDVGRTVSDGDDRDNQLFVTGGVSHGIELLCATQTEPGDVVLVERPTYFLVKGILDSHRLRVRCLPMTSDGDGGAGGVGRIDVPRLRSLLESENGYDPKPTMMYLIPSHQNPTGRTLTVSERRSLANLAVEHGMILVADEAYHLLDWRDDEENGRRPARMAAFNGGGAVVASEDGSGGGASSDATGGEGLEEDGESHGHQRRRRRRQRRQKGCCVSVSSFTKIFAPGVRCGWVEGPERVVRDLSRYGYIQSQGGIAPFMGRFMSSALQSGQLDEYLHKLKVAYAERSRKLCDILGEETRIRIRQRPLGGYFLWVQFPSSVDSEGFLKFCLGRDVKFMPGSYCDPVHNIEEGEGELLNGSTAVALKSCARLCFADMDFDDIVEGANQFVDAFRAYMDHLDNRDS